MRQLSFLLARAGGGCLRPPDIALTRRRRDRTARSLTLRSIALTRRRRDWAVRSLTIRSIARRNLIMLTTAPVRSRLRLRMRD